MLDKEIKGYKVLSFTFNYTKSCAIKAKKIGYNKGFKAALGLGE
jgi:hypothetical protein